MSITPEQLTEFVGNEENKDIFNQVAKAAGYEHIDNQQGLLNKRDELLAANRRLKDDKLKAQKKLDSIDLEAYNDFVTKQNENLDVSEKTQRELAIEREANAKMAEQYKSLENQFNRTLVNSELSKTFDEIGIDPQHKSMLATAFSGKAKIENDNGTRQVIIDNGDGLGLPTQDFFKNWSETDQGKLYLKQPENSGANAQRFKQSTPRTITMQEFNTLSPAEKAKAARSEDVIISG